LHQCERNGDRQQNAYMPRATQNDGHRRGRAVRRFYKPRVRVIRNDCEIFGDDCGLLRGIQDVAAGAHDPFKFLAPDVVVSPSQHAKLRRVPNGTTVAP
jgi:hypothetical protein